MAERINLYKIYKRGEMYYAYFSIPTTSGHTRFRCSTGCKDKKQAEIWCVKRAKELTEVHTDKGDRITFRNACNLYYQNIGQQNSRPLAYLRRLKKLVDFFTDITFLDELTPLMIEKYLNERQKKGVSNSTINQDLYLISAIINESDKMQYIIPNVRVRNFAKRVPAENIKFLPNMEYAQRIIDRARDCFKPVIYTALYTGMRKSNILNLKWQDVDLENNIIMVRVKDCNKEGGKNLTIPIIPKLKEILLSLPRVNEYVFNRDDGKPFLDTKEDWFRIFYYKHRTSKGFVRILRDETLPYINFHSLRHTCATWVLKKTKNLRITKDILGHANISTTLKYAHILSDDKYDALNKTFE